MKRTVIFAAVTALTLAAGGYAYAAPSTTTAAPQESPTPVLDASEHGEQGETDAIMPGGALAVPEEESARPAVTMQSSADSMTSAAEDIGLTDSGILSEGEYIPPEPIGVQGSGDVKNMESYYYENGYPEYISYINAYDKLYDEHSGSTLLMYEVGLTDMSEENRNAILSIGDETCYFSFGQATHSYNVRYKVYEELRREFPDAYVRMSDNTETIYLIALNGEQEEYIERLGTEYGSLVAVADKDGEVYSLITGAVDGSIAPVEGGMGIDGGLSEIAHAGDSGGNIEPNSTIPLIAAVCAVIIAAAVAGFLLLRRSRLRVSSDGTAAAVSRLTRAEVKKAVADSAEQPSEALRNRITRELDEL